MTYLYVNLSLNDKMTVSGLKTSDEISLKTVTD